MQITEKIGILPNSQSLLNDPNFIKAFLSIADCS